jgi:phospholipid/cholesterol/gamma-HCH transport system substrate-binding protein
VNFDEFLAALDAETQAYLQELLAGFGQGVKNNGKALSATLKRFDPTARYAQEIASQLEIRHANIARSIHNFRLLVEAIGGKDKQLAELVDASNAVFKTFAEQSTSVEKTLHLLPGALSKTNRGLGKLARASSVLGPTLTKLDPFAKALAPAQEASRSLFKQSTPIVKNEIRPFARQILPVVNQFEPSIKELGEAFPGLSSSFSVFNELFNELAYNPGPNQGGFMFFLTWANHNLNSVLSTADAHGPVGRTVAYLNCELLPLLTGVSEINATVRLLIALFNPPTGAECTALGLAPGGASTGKAAAARAHTHTKAGEGFTMKLLGSKHSAFGALATASGRGR